MNQIKYDHKIEKLWLTETLMFTEEEELLKEHSANGWELCGVVERDSHVKYYFKRRQQEVLSSNDGIADWASDHLPKDGQ
jgi:hypothetical protein